MIAINCQCLVVTGRDDATRSRRCAGPTTTWHSTRSMADAAGTAATDLRRVPAGWRRRVPKDCWGSRAGVPPAGRRPARRTGRLRLSMIDRARRGLLERLAGVVGRCRSARPPGAQRHRPAHGRPARALGQGAAHGHLLRVAGSGQRAVRPGRRRGRGRPGDRPDRGDEAVQRDQVGPRRTGRPGGLPRPAPWSRPSSHSSRWSRCERARPLRPCHRLGPLRAVPGPDQPRPRADGRHVGRMDRVAHRDPRAARRGGRRDDRLDGRGRRAARDPDGGHRPGRDRPDPAGHPDPGLLDALDGGAGQGGDRQHPGGRDGRRGGLLGVRLCLCDRPRLHHERHGPPRPGHRRRAADPLPRLHRPQHLHPVRRRRRGRGPVGLGRAGRRPRDRDDHRAAGRLHDLAAGRRLDGPRRRPRRSRAASTTSGWKARRPTASPRGPSPRPR